MNDRPDSAFPIMSDGSLTANLAVFVGELLGRVTRHLVDGKPIPLADIRVPLPFSRAEGTDYLRIVELWNQYREEHPLEAPSRGCPACRSTDSRFEFYSYDRYPYHSCVNCGTWFVPLAIDDSVINGFFRAVPEARELSDKMMAGRDRGTQATDRVRFGRYFDMLAPVTSGLSRPPRYLDIGSGVGHSVELAAERGWDALGVELSEVAVATARASGRNVIRPNQHDRRITYDVISLFETLEHITDPDPVLEEVSQSMAPGGVVMITVPHRASFEISILRGRCFHVFGGSENVGHINLLDARGIEALLERHGLTTMFLDGEFSSDLAQVFAHLSSGNGSAAVSAKSDYLTLRLPQSAHELLNNVGPAFSVWERALKRSPILIAIACRISEKPAALAMQHTLLQNWRREMDVAMAEGERALQAHESTLRSLLADLQGEITRRDTLMAEKMAELQHEINLRDTLLEKSRARFDRTIEGMGLYAVGAIGRLLRRSGVLPKRDQR